jgi:hypothetical protein
MNRRRLLPAVILLLAACDGALRDPVGVGSGSNNGGTIGGGGGGGSSVLLGAWQANLIFELSNDIQRHTITWSFNPDGGCRRTVEIFSVLEDRSLTTTVNCTFRSSGSDVAITYEGNTSAVNFSWSLENFSRDHLILDGVAYDRIG